MSSSAGSTTNCLIYKMAWPVTSATDAMNHARQFACEFTESPESLCGELSRCDVGVPDSGGACGFQLHWVESKHVHDGVRNASAWQSYFERLNGNMSVWNAFMHNGIQLYVPDVGSIIAHMRAKGTVDFMERISGSSLEFRHVLFSAGGRVIELVGDNSGEGPQVEWADEECPAAHDVTSSAHLLRQAWNNSGAGVRANGLQLPMLLRTSTSSGDAKSASEVLGRELSEQTDAYLKRYHDASECTVYSLGFKQSDWTEVQFVTNNLAATGEISLRQYDRAIFSTHERLVGSDTDKWDHFLDQHIGFYAEYLEQKKYSQCELATMVEQGTHELGWPMAHRTDLECSQADSCTNHMYIGVPHSSVAFEYNVDCGITSNRTFPSICLCDEWNNDEHWWKTTGTQCVRAQANGTVVPTLNDTALNSTSPSSNATSSTR